MTTRISTGPHRRRPRHRLDDEELVGVARPAAGQPAPEVGRVGGRHEVTSRHLLHLQRAAGNGVVSRLVRPAPMVVHRGCACGGSCQTCSGEERDAEAGPAVQRSTATLPPSTRDFWETWGAQIVMFRRMFQEQRYGCWCGPGNVCGHVTNRIDACCKRHDEDYGVARVTSDDPAPPGWHNMWSPEGFKRSMIADARLVACTQATKYDLNFYGPAAALYREGVALIFGFRATVAAWLIANGY